MKNKTLALHSYRLARVPSQSPLVTDVMVEYGQLQVKSVAVGDEHEPP